MVRSRAMDKDEMKWEGGHRELFTHRQMSGSRLGTYSVLGAVTGIVPLPWVPSLFVRRVRGALAHDITARHGLSLTPQARDILANPLGSDAARGWLSQGVTFAVSRALGRLGPLSFVAPLRSALGTFVLGHLLHRYLETARTARAVRIDVEEARRVRRAMDQALIYAVTTQASEGRETPPAAGEDLRDDGTRLTDGVILSVVSLPGWLVRRLEAAFDEVITNVRA